MYQSVARFNAVKLLVLQVLSALLISVFWVLCANIADIPRLLLSAAVCAVPNFLFNVSLMRLQQAQPKFLAVCFFLGELIKLLLVAVLLAWMILSAPSHYLAVVCGFVAAQLGAWAAPFLPLLNRQRVSV